MTQEDVLAALQQLPLNEKLVVLDALARMVRREVAHDALEKRGEAIPPFAELRGVLASDAHLPDDYDWKDDYTDHLMKKYA